MDADCCEVVSRRSDTVPLSGRQIWRNRWGSRVIEVEASARLDAVSTNSRWRKGNREFQHDVHRKEPYAASDLRGMGAGLHASEHAMPSDCEALESGEQNGEQRVRKMAASKPGLGSTVVLRGGLEKPALGIGTHPSSFPGECRNTVVDALSVGYRLLDTAAAYHNEEEIGAAIRDSGVLRSDVFVTTKFQRKEHAGGGPRVRQALLASLRRFGLEYVDLYLIHSPKGGHLLEVWDAMLAVRDAGLARAVGVSNFGAAHLQGLKAAGREMPEVNQIELHCWLQQRKITDLHKREQIVTMAYSPLAEATKFEKTKLASLAREIGRTEAQVAIRWSLQSGYVVIPKTVRNTRIRENAVDDFELSSAHMARIAELDCNHRCVPRASSAMDLPWDALANGGDIDGDWKGKKGKGKGHNWWSVDWNTSGRGSLT